MRLKVKTKIWYSKLKRVLGFSHQRLDHIEFGELFVYSVGLRPTTIYLDQLRVVEDHLSDQGFVRTSAIQADLYGVPRSFDALDDMAEALTRSGAQSASFDATYRLTGEGQPEGVEVRVIVKDHAGEITGRMTHAARPRLMMVCNRVAVVLNWWAPSRQRRVVDAMVFALGGAVAGTVAARALDVDLSRWYAWLLISAGGILAPVAYRWQLDDRPRCRVVPEHRGDFEQRRVTQVEVWLRGLALPVMVAALIAFGGVAVKWFA